MDLVVYKGRKHRFTELDIRTVIAQSRSMTQACKKLGLGGQGSAARKKIVALVAALNIDISHFDARQKHRAPHTCIEDYLKNPSDVPSSHLRERLIEAGYFRRACMWCAATHWFGLPITLELDHIDGNPRNNELSNLRLLCMNCHSFTPTWKGRKLKRERFPLPGTPVPLNITLSDPGARFPTRICVDCNMSIRDVSSRCVGCAPKDEARRAKLRSP